MEDLSEALNTILQLIVGQSMYVQRSCSINEQPMGTNQSCLIVSTLFLRSSIASDNVFSVYRLKPLSAIVDDEQFMYSNLPEIIGINKDDETVIFWNTVPKKNEYLFSIFVHCKTNPPIISLKRIPCLFEIFSQDNSIASSCKIRRSRQIESEVMNIDHDGWLFSRTEQTLYCNLQSNTGKFGGLFSIHEPSIVQIPCDNNIKCTNVQLASTACSNRIVLIKSIANEKYERLSSMPWSIKNMTMQLLTIYNLTTRNSLTSFGDNFKDNKFNPIMGIKEIGNIILSTVFIIFISLVLLFIRWIKHLVQKRIDKLEKDLDDIVHNVV
ncbi:unnamed protein product [Didymodactylos carnosus]|uniref:Uncharacterized protein n=1 Tax=Didymodactylos carnosus TaxID=1234261 RepID=A0A8S2K757_9BILA|nr:unnamed protein product [Didymodactylos carnosus]CAF3840388.1 unnamed protein product [Didymodactylos carnosus]